MGIYVPELLWAARSSFTTHLPHAKCSREMVTKPAAVHVVPTPNKLTIQPKRQKIHTQRAEMILTP